MDILVQLTYFMTYKLCKNYDFGYIYVFHLHVCEDDID